MSVPDLLRELRAAVGGRGLSYTSSTAAWDIYEGYIFGIVIRAASAAGGRIGYWDVFGRPAARLVFRTGPGMIYSTAQPFTHATLEFPNCAPLEVHVGVRVQGRSGVLHECDVLVLDADEATLARTRGVAPRGTRALLAIECKYYTTAGLTVGLARGFHGLHADVGLKFPYFVANLRAQRVERYLSFHNRSWENGVLPNTSEATYLEGMIRDSFKRYQAVRALLAP